MSGGFMYLAAVIDGHSRFVLSRELSPWTQNSASSPSTGLFSRERRRSSTPAGYGPSTRKAFLAPLKEKEIPIGMGRGRALDDIFAERSRRPLKQEGFYLNGYERVRDLRCGLREYMLSTWGPP